jgi:hypothetical protein
LKVFDCALTATVAATNASTRDSFFINGLDFITRKDIRGVDFSK